MSSFFRPDSEQVLDVTELTRQIKIQLEGSFTQLWVQGEVSNLRIQSSGHIYFSLKDSKSQLPCVLFARDAAQQGFVIADGMMLTLFGNLSLYEPHGRYQLIAKIALQNGQGNLQLEFERLKQKLFSEGLFDKECKQALPKLPKRIAVVTSPTGAAIRDFLSILQRLSYKGEVVIFPSRVQGKKAATELAQMFERVIASDGFDLVVITRGGGSIEDLWPFNDEALARAISNCPLPTISAVGHEIDHVLTDYVADKRAETPSAAAELIASLYLEAETKLLNAKERLLEQIKFDMTNWSQHLEGLKNKMQLIDPKRKVQMLGMKLDDLENQLGQSLKTRLGECQTQLGRALHGLIKHHPRNRVALSHQSLDNFDKRLSRAVQTVAKTKLRRIAHLQKRLENSSFQATLRRGYSILKRDDGSIIDRARSGKKQDRITAHLQDGELPLKVIQ